MTTTVPSIKHERTYEIFVAHGSELNHFVDQILELRDTIHKEHQYPHLALLCPKDDGFHISVYSIKDDPV